MRLLRLTSFRLAWACVLGLWAVPVFAVYDVIVTPDQFNPQTWGGNLSQDTVGAYPGDNAAGYYYTNNFGNSPSATIVIPLPAGMPAGAHVYNVYEWDPSVTPLSGTLSTLRRTVR